jgi:hypothetical protein
MNEKKPTYRVEIKNSSTPPNEAYGWKIYRNDDVLYQTSKAMTLNGLLIAASGVPTLLSEGNITD